MTDQSTISFRAIAAATGDPIEPDFLASSLADVASACEAADVAFDPYRFLPSARRAEFIDAIAEEILALGDELLDRAHIESGLPMARLTGERGRTVGQLRLFADVVRSEEWRRVRIDPALPEREPLPRPDLRMRMIPIGPVAVFGASNFPLAFSTAGGDTASALAAGCPVVVKGHPAHPGTDRLVAEAIKQAAARTGMPPGVFGHVQGPGNELGAALVTDPRIAAVGFTGSRAGGLALVRLAQARPVPIPVYAEMSSINPVVLLPGALADKAEALGAAFVGSLTMGAGQFCTNPGLVIAVANDHLATFERAAKSALEAQAVQTMLTPGICAAFASGTDKLASHAEVEEIGAGTGGNGKTSERARLFATTGAAVIEHPELLEEVFGSSSLVVRCEDHAELVDVLRDFEGQLTATIQLADTDYDLAREIVPVLERKAGRILVNGWPTGVEVAPAMVHGGPYPATSDGRTTSVGTLAIERFLRPVCYQDFPPTIRPHDVEM